MDVIEQRLVEHPQVADAAVLLSSDLAAGMTATLANATGGAQIEQTAESAKFAIGAGTARGTNCGLNGFYQRIASIDVDAGLLV